MLRAVAYMSLGLVTLAFADEPKKEPPAPIDLADKVANDKAWTDKIKDAEKGRNIALSKSLQMDWTKDTTGKFPIGSTAVFKGKVIQVLPTEMSPFARKKEQGAYLISLGANRQEGIYFFTDDKETALGLKAGDDTTLEGVLFDIGITGVYQQPGLAVGKAHLKKPAEVTPAEAKVRSFVGRWTIANDKGVVSQYINLRPNMTATKDHAPTATATWEVVGDECRITWSDGWKQILRPEKDAVLEITFAPGTSWNDKPAHSSHGTKGQLK